MTDNRFAVQLAKDLAHVLHADVVQVIGNPVHVASFTIADHHRAVGMVGDLCARHEATLGAFYGVAVEGLPGQAPDLVYAARQDTGNACENLEDARRALHRFLSALRRRGLGGQQTIPFPGHELIHNLRHAVAHAEGQDAIAAVTAPRPGVVAALAEHLAEYSLHLHKVARAQQMLVTQACRTVSTSLPAHPGELPSAMRISQGGLEAAANRMASARKHLREVQDLARTALQS
jgi:hypothetical protein